MVKINGVKINTSATETKSVLPSINEILNRMDNNYQSINEIAKTTSNKPSGTIPLNNNEKSKSNTYNTYYCNEACEKGNQTENLFDGGNLLTSLLPMLLSGNKNGGIFENNSPIMKEILRQTKNPMLQKVFEIMSKMPHKNTAKTCDGERKTRKDIDIDKFVKTSDYDA